MDLSIVLWIGGMLFSLGIFAVKVGFGLGFSGMGWKGILMTLSLYLVLFVAIAVLSGQLMTMLEPVLRKGPYLHALMAIGMIAWGTYLLRNSECGIRNYNSRNRQFSFHSLQSSIRIPQSALLLVPCPVCLTAMTFSTWSALSVIKLASALVGLGLAIAFILLSLTIYFSLKLITLNSSLITQKIGLGLSMIGIGIYFIASLFLPAKIEEAKVVYRSFIAEGGSIDINRSIGAFALLFVALVIGYFANKKSEV